MSDKKHNEQDGDMPKSVTQTFNQQDINFAIKNFYDSFRDYLLISLWRQVLQVYSANNDELEEDSLVEDMLNYWFDSEIKKIENKISNYNETIESGYLSKQFGVNEDDMPDTEDVRVAHVELLKYFKKTYLDKIKSQIT